MAEFFFQAEDGIRDVAVTGVQTCSSDLKPVWSDSRMTAVSRCNSARDRSSDQSLSPVVIGRFTTAATQSSVPAGLKEIRSEERRVGNECRSRGSPYH